MVWPEGFYKWEKVFLRLSPQVRAMRKLSCAPGNQSGHLQVEIVHWSVRWPHGWLELFAYPLRDDSGKLQM